MAIEQKDLTPGVYWGVQYDYKSYTELDGPQEPLRVTVQPVLIELVGVAPFLRAHITDVGAPRVEQTRRRFPGGVSVPVVGIDHEVHFLERVTPPPKLYALPINEDDYDAS